jgi:hypothetical protein
MFKFLTAIRYIFILGFLILFFISYNINISKESIQSGIDKKYQRQLINLVR